MAKFLKIGFFFLVGILLIWWSLHQIPPQEWNKFTKALAKSKFWLILPIFFILGLSHFVRALRWRLIMEPLGYKPSIMNTFLAVLIGYLANLAIPRLGEVLKCTLLAKYEKVPAEKIVGTIVAERAFDVISLGIVFLLALTLQFNVIQAGWQQLQNASTSTNEHSNNGLLIFLGAVVVMLIIAVILYFTFKHKFETIIKSIKTILIGIWEGVISATKLKKHNLFFFYSFSIWFLYLLATYIGLYGTEGTASSFSTAISCLAYASIGMIITPGGIGAYAFFMAKVLELNGIEYTLGLANGTLQWFSQVIIVIVLGGLALIMLPFINKQVK
ncbi:MAG: lysylphosphatidylglycerol synthase transmembrane domain-containing protein [Bacteroidetes bacterium]|nr:lysylphosphatidylglycerol synthase transmembrane domain-containing protein [Bacteroidota bacterium]